MAKYWTLTVPSVSRALAVNWIWRPVATELGVAVIVVNVGARLVAATMLMKLVGDAATLSELSRTSATISVKPRGTPTNEALRRHVLVSWSRAAKPRLLRLR